jgi:hypothetical protein
MGLEKLFAAEAKASSWSLPAVGLAEEEAGAEEGGDAGPAPVVDATAAAGVASPPAGADVACAAESADVVASAMGVDAVEPTCNQNLRGGGLCAH